MKKLHLQSIVLAILLLTFSGCSQDEKIRPNTSDKSKSEKWSSTGYFLDGVFFSLTYQKHEGDSVIFKDPISQRNYSNLLERMHEIVIEHQPAEDNYLHYYTSHEIFKDYDRFKEDTLFTLDKTKDSFAFLTPPFQT